jgi:putative transposase
MCSISKQSNHWLWRAVDQDGMVLDEILQSKRDKRAAKRLLWRLMKRHGQVPKRIVTDKLRSYGAAKREIAPVSVVRVFGSRGSVI